MITMYLGSFKQNRKSDNMFNSFLVRILNKNKMQNNYDITNKKHYPVRNIDENYNIYFYNDKDDLHVVTQADIDSKAIKLLGTLNHRKVTNTNFLGRELKEVKNIIK